MVVEMFSITQGYGFCTDGYLQVFFRVEDFTKNHPQEPQPILGEIVNVELIVEPQPKAKRVVRTQTPQLLTGTVLSFDSAKGWGFAHNHLGNFFIHKSDFLESFVPIIGNTVSFYSGKKKNKLRACYIVNGNIFEKP